MKSFLLSIFALFITFAAQAQNPGAILGTWFNEEKDGKIEIYEISGKYFGKIVWLKTPYESDGKTLRKDNKNSDANLRQRTILNSVILSGFWYDNGKWTGGEIYDPKSGNTYSSEMKLDGNTLKIRGYIGLPMFGRTTQFTKA